MREGWEKKKIIDILLVTDYVANGSFKSLADNVTYLRDKNYALLLRTTDFTNNFNKSFVYVNEASFNFLKKSNVYPKDIVICNVGSVGLTFLVPDLGIPMTLGPNSILLRGLKLEEIDNNFIYYLFTSPFGQSLIESITTGTTQSKFNKTNFRQLEIPIPLLQEQQQIVAILDQALEVIDKAKVNIEKNIVNTKELFQSKLNAIFSQKGEGWEDKSFKEVCVLQRGFDLPTRLRKKGKYDLVTSSGINDSHSDYKVVGPGVVTGRSGSIGNVLYIENNLWPLNTTLYIKDFNNNNEKYIYYFLRHFDLSKYSTGTGVPTLNRNFVHDEKVNTTTIIKEQIEIVRVLDLLIIKNKLIELHYKQKLNNLEDLKKSILQKAFSGELTNKSALSST